MSARLVVAAHTVLNTTNLQASDSAVLRPRGLFAGLAATWCGPGPQSVGEVEYVHAFGDLDVALALPQALNRQL